MGETERQEVERKERGEREGENERDIVRNRGGGGEVLMRAREAREGRESYSMSKLMK